MSKRKRIRSDMGWFDETSVTVRGMDLCQDVMGKLSLGDFAFLEILGRPPTAQQSVVFNAMLAALVEHGMTPMAIAARLTYLGAPEALQGAIAAGILGMGTTFAGTTEGSARLLQQAIRIDTASQDLPRIASQIVDEHLSAKRAIPGIGHPVHKPTDPRAVRLFELASENGLTGSFVTLMAEISAAAERALKRPGQLPVNATGAIGALASQLQIPWQLCRGLAVMGRCVGMVGHLAEELRDPIAMEVVLRIEEEASSHFR